MLWSLKVSGELGKHETSLMHYLSTSPIIIFLLFGIFIFGPNILVPASTVALATSDTASPPTIATRTGATTTISATNAPSTTTTQINATTASLTDSPSIATEDDNSTTFSADGGEVGSGTEPGGDGGEGNSNGGSSLYIAGIISGVLVVLVVLGCALCIGCCYALIKRGNKFSLKNLIRHQSKKCCVEWMG